MALREVVLLQDHGPRVGDVGNDVLDGGVAHRNPVLSDHALFLQCLGDAVAGVPGKVAAKDVLDDFALLRDDAELLAVPLVPVGSLVTVGDAFLEPLSGRPPDVGGDALTFRLRKGCQERQEKFPVRGEGGDALALEPYLNTDVLQVPDCVQAVHRVPGKAADGLCQDNVDFPGIAICHEPVELVPVSRACSRYAFVGVDPRVLPFGICLYQLAVVADLRGKGMQEKLRFHRNAGVCRDPFPGRDAHRGG